jgi:hypothetical protein
MFGFTGADNIEAVARKKGYMAEARARWPFLTQFDASTIKNERQLVTMVKDRCSRSQAHAEADVRQWMRDKDFSVSEHELGNLDRQCAT